MKINQSSLLRVFDVYLNGVKLDSCLAADEKKGIAIIDNLGPDGKPQHYLGGHAEAGDLVFQDLVVQKVHGKVVVKITPPDGMTRKQIRKLTKEDYIPDQIHRIVEVEADGHRGFELEPAFQI